MDGWMDALVFSAELMAPPFLFQFSLLLLCLHFIQWHPTHVAPPHVWVTFTISMSPYQRVFCVLSRKCCQISWNAAFSLSAASPCVFPKVGHLPVSARWKSVGSLKTAAAATTLSGFGRRRQIPLAFEVAASRMTFFFLLKKKKFKTSKSHSFTPCAHHQHLCRSPALESCQAPIALITGTATLRGRRGQAV